MSVYAASGLFRKAMVAKRSCLSLLFVLLPSFAIASPFDCENARCGLRSTGAYAHLALGTVSKVATAAEAERVFAWTRNNGYWSSLPDDKARFGKTIRLVSVKIPGPAGPEAVTLVMGREHFDAIEIAPGDFVRYTPHETERSAESFEDTAEAAYWNLYGCIAVLCRAEDNACPDGYRPGVFRRKDGVQLDLHSEEPTVGGAKIDIGTYRPLQPND